MTRINNGEHSYGTTAATNPPQESSVGYLLDAKALLIAAEHLLNGNAGASLPAYFFIGRSIELSLKAFLLGRGMSSIELKSRRNNFGHDLVTLLEEAVRRDLAHEVELDSDDYAAIGLLNHDYQGKRMEYRVTDGKYHLPLIQLADAVARKLVTGLDKNWKRLQ